MSSNLIQTKWVLLVEFCEKNGGTIHNVFGEDGLG
jgi:hypothetical protein